ncbi:MAG TPA: hypothetical protein VK215_12875, partial [Acidimicrobiales bacterium]|nr:hypothetical protein [Acidimicrobiales bacterium]
MQGAKSLSAIQRSERGINLLGNLLDLHLREGLRRGRLLVAHFGRGGAGSLLVLAIQRSERGINLLGNLLDLRLREGLRRGRLLVAHFGR